MEQLQQLDTECFKKEGEAKNSIKLIGFPMKFIMEKYQMELWFFILAITKNALIQVI